MIRRALLAGCAALALAVGQARAQGIPTYDNLNYLINTITSTNAVTTAKQAIQLVQEAQRTYSLLTNTYNAIAHSTNLIDTAAALGGVSRQYLPGEVSEVLNGVTTMGYGSRGGVMGLLNGAGALLGSNRFFQSSRQDDWQREMERRESVTANIQRIATSGMEDSRIQLANLGILRARLEAAQDGTEVSAVNGLIGIMGHNLEIHRGNMQQAMILAQAETRVAEQRAEQRQRRDAEELLRNTSPLPGPME